MRPLTKPHPLTLPLPNLEATASLAASLARLVEKGEAVLLEGDLGVGKTAFARFFIQSLLGTPEEVPSPTFTLVQTFDTPRFTLWHFDLYRLKGEEEVYELGIEEAFAEGVSLIEWPQLAAPALPKDVLSLTLAFGATEGERQITLEGTGQWQEKLKQLMI